MSFRWFTFASRNAPGRGLAADVPAEEDRAGVDAAIARVLAAEVLAREDGVAAAAEAEAIVDDARRKARAIGSRGERRMAAACARYRAATERGVARLHAESAALEARHPLDAGDRTHVDAAVAAVAADLSGGA